MIANKIIAWQKQHGRHNLPWQKNITAYRVWISEIMLQQTQVQTVIPYYNRFMQQFTDIESLAMADEETVIKHWAGLGYYQRARNLHQCAKTLLEDYNGEFPKNADELISLPGIGKSTAHAILSITHELPYAILDGNVKRVLARYYGITDPLVGVAAIREMWKIAEMNMPTKECRTYTQGIMDLGANICKRNPLCTDCPLESGCQAKRLDIATDIPIKAKKRIKKRSETRYFLCIFLDNRIWMIKRPSKGIWPSLWTPPILENKPLKSGRVLEAFRHTFTHFHMDIHPTVIRINDQVQLSNLLHIHQLNKDCGQWFNYHQLNTEAIPTAVKKCMALIHADKVELPV